MDLKQITEKESELSSLYGRMDADAAVFNLAAYSMTGVNGTKIDKAYHVTLTDPKQYLEDVVAKLTTVSRQVVVESDKLTGEKTSGIESFVSDLQFEVDSLLAAKGEPDEFTQHCDLVCSRGPIAAQVLLRAENGELIAERRVIDFRYFSYELDKAKLAWGCASTLRSKRDIESEYPGVTVATTATVRDFYDDKIHAVFIGDNQVKEEANPYMEPPFVIAIPQTSSARRDTNYYKYMGDSILRTLRTEGGKYLFEEKNYIASYLKTLSGEALFPPVQFPAPPEGDYQQIPDKVTGSGQMVQTKQPAMAYPKSELSQGTAMYIQTINEAIQRGTFATLQHGIIDLPQSGVAITQKMALQNESLLPRLNCIASLFQSMSKMSIRQFIRIGETLELGEEGHRRVYSPVDLDGKYVIKYRFFTTSQEQLAGATSIASAIGPFVSKKFIQEKILMLQDPAGENSRMDEERAAKADPALDLFNQMRGFVKAQEASEDADYKAEHDVQARLILSRIISILKQRKASETQPMPVNLEQNAKVQTPGAPGIPVFGGSQAVKTQ